MSVAYLKDLAERAAASFVGAILPVFIADEGLNLLAVDWKQTLLIGAGAAVVAVLKGLAARLRGNAESASLVK